MDVIRGTLGELPALVVGSGPPLVWLGGLSPEAGVDRPAMRRTNLASIAPYTREHQVFFTNRRPGMQRGMTMAQIAAEHADALRVSFGGQPVDVAGLSTGGSIAQQLAADHPDVVRRLVLQSTACRLGPLGKSLQRQIAARVRAGAYRKAFAVAAADLVPRAQLPAAALGWAIGPRLFPETSDLHDMATTIEAEDTFDLADCATPIRAPTLLVAGSDDRYYAPALFTETERLIPDCRTHILRGRGHITALAHRSTPPAVLGFLR